MSDFPKTQTGKIQKHLLKKEGVTNDTWKTGAQNHNRGEGSFEDRKYNALKVQLAAFLSYFFFTQRTFVSIVFI